MVLAWASIRDGWAVLLQMPDGRQDWYLFASNVIRKAAGLVPVLGRHCLTVRLAGPGRTVSLAGDEALPFKGGALQDNEVGRRQVPH